MSASTAFGGLGLFFVGVRLVGTHVRQLVDDSVRMLLARYLKRRGVAPIVGMLTGAVTQSSSAAAFIAIGLMSSGAIAMSSAFNLLVWANVGTSALVLLAAVDVRALALFLIGSIGVAFVLGADQVERRRHLMYALFGIAVLLFGLSLVKEAAAQARDNFWVREFIEFSGSGTHVALIAGVVLATILQSSSVVSVLSLPLVSEGLIDFKLAALMTYGASVGSAIATMLLASGMTGPSRELGLCQVLLRVLTEILLIALYWAESEFGIPPIMASIQSATSSLALQVSLVYLLFQLVSLLLSQVLEPLILRWSKSLSPSASDLDPNRPKFLFDEAIRDPNTALGLARLEYRRLVQLLPHWLDPIRPEAERAPEAAGLSDPVKTGKAVSKRLISFLEATQDANPDFPADLIFEARNRAQALCTLQDLLEEFCSILSTIDAPMRPAFAERMTEGLHALLLVTADAAQDESEESIEILRTMTDGRSPIATRVRSELASGDFAHAARESMVEAALTFDRIVWLLGRMTLVRAAS